jgi:DNA-directed RNA polymerase specialized sigma24 family protein
MVVVRTVEDFYRKNGTELRAFMRYKTGISDVDIINDTIQEFYKRLVMYRSLELYDQERAPTDKQNQLNFETWICNNLCWLFSIMKKRNFKDRFGVSQVDKINESNGTPNSVDVWEVLNTTGNTGDNKFFSVEERFRVSQIEQEEENDVYKSLNAFVRYIEKSLPDKKAQEIKKYMLYRAQGLNNTDIAVLLGKSNNMVKFIRQDAERRYKKWIKPRVLV